VSHVYAISLMVGLSSPPESLVAVNKWLEENGDDPLVDLSAHAVGSKHPQVRAYLAGYNGIDTAEFIRVVKAQNWEDGCSLIIWPEDSSIIEWHVDSEYL
jgi:hypothetical protein